jgi:hypothetical protein
MRRVLPGGATLGEASHGGDERPVACRPGSAVLERTRPRRPADLPQPGAGQTAADKPASAPSPPKPQDLMYQNPPSETAQKPPTSWLRENIEKVVIPVVIAVLTAVILAWLGLNK